MKGDLRYYRILFINCRVPIYRLHCIAVAGASKHFTPEASPCIDIRSHQAKSSTKLLNESIYSTHVSTFIIFVIQCVNNSMYCNFIYFLYCIHHRNCTFPCSACRHRSQITDPRSSLQQQGIETKKASKTESCGKSSEEHCSARTNKKKWNFQKYVFDINIYKHWVGKQSFYVGFPWELSSFSWTWCCHSLMRITLVDNCSTYSRGWVSSWHNCRAEANQEYGSTPLINMKPMLAFMSFSCSQTVLQFCCLATQWLSLNSHRGTYVRRVI